LTCRDAIIHAPISAKPNCSHRKQPWQ